MDFRNLIKAGADDSQLLLSDLFNEFGTLKDELYDFFKTFSSDEIMLTVFTRDAVMEAITRYEAGGKYFLIFEMYGPYRAYTEYLHGEIKSSAGETASISRFSDIVKQIEMKKQQYIQGPFCELALPECIRYKTDISFFGKMKNGKNIRRSSISEMEAISEQVASYTVVPIIQSKTVI